MKNKNLKLLLTVICMLAAGICYHYSRQTGRTQESGQVLEFSEEDRQRPKSRNSSNGIKSDTGLRYERAADSELETGAKPAVPFTEEISCFVHVCGEVKEPGVYEMKQGDRVFHAIEKAGGFTDEAAQGYLNLALEVTDGMKLAVPPKEWVDAQTFQEGESEEVPTGKVDLNTATKEELMTLKGVGQAKAESILEYRDTHGKFQAIEDIMNIPGIKEGAFEKIKDDITV